MQTNHSPFDTITKTPLVITCDKRKEKPLGPSSLTRGHQPLFGFSQEHLSKQIRSPFDITKWYALMLI